MFTDIVGYTAMMQENERKAKKKRDRHRKVLEYHIAAYQGKMLQHFGDGTLSIFTSAIHAASCAVRIQQELQKEPVIPIRIGLHLGDVVYNEEGVYGDSVNIASRIESIAVPGSVIISEKIYDEIKNQPGLPVVSLGKHLLKNVEEPIEVFALANVGLIIPNPEDVDGRTRDEGISVAVLPFVNMSPDSDNEYFSDGITEELINSLSNVPGLHVKSRTSTFAFKGSSLGVRDIGTKLNVTHLIEGSVRKAGERVRITAQLINVQDGYQYWSEQFDRNLEDIFKVQDEISRHIVDKLREELSLHQDTEALFQSRTYEIDAYNYYLMGLFYWNKWTPEDVRKAVNHFEYAISTDAKLAPAYSYLANCYIYFGSQGILKPFIAYPKAKEYAERALQLDDKIAEPHISMAMIKLMFEWDFQGSYNYFLRALELSPRSSLAHYTFSVYQLITGNIAESLKEVETAIQLDPLSLLINDHWGLIYFFEGRIDEAIKQFEKNLEMDPSFRNSMEHVSLAYTFKGEHEKAINVLKEIKTQGADDTSRAALLGYVYARKGEGKEAEECLKQIRTQEENAKQASFAFDYALIYTGLKEYDKMFQYLNKSVEERLAPALFIGNNPIWKAIREDRRFKKILAKMGLGT